MALRSIEIICPNGPTQQESIRRIRRAIVNIELTEKKKIPVQIITTTDLRKASRYSGGMIPPLIIINGNLEFAGKTPEYEALRAKLMNILRSG